MLPTSTMKQQQQIKKEPKRFFVFDPVVRSGFPFARRYPSTVKKTTKEDGPKKNKELEGQPTGNSRRQSRTERGREWERVTRQQQQPDEKSLDVCL